MEIKNRFSGEVIAAGDTIPEAIQYADLRDADLRGVNLQYADLQYADLRGADLQYADLRDVSLNWRSHDLIAEILRQAACGDIDKIKIAGLVMIYRDYCWGDFIDLDDPLAGWALGELSKWVKEGEDTPKHITS